MRARLRALFCNDMAPSAAEAFLDRLGADGWPPSSYRWSDWRYDHLDAIPASYVLCMRVMTFDMASQTIFAERLRADRVIHVDAGHQVMNTRPQALAEIVRLEAREAH